jgi:hypothetical protein
MKWSGPGVFVGGTWLALTAAAVFYVARFAAPDPFGDEWDLVPGMTYQQPYVPWLWAQHNEHRLPLPKLVYTWLWHLGGADARAGSYATVAVLSLLSLAMIRTARQLRGHVDYADAFFPIAFLNWGHFENYLIGFQISFAMSMGLACAWMLAALAWLRQREPANLKWVGVCLVALPLCGAHGLVYTLPLGLASFWLVRSGPRFSQIYVATTVAVAWLFTGYYFRGYVTPDNHPASAGLIPSAMIALETLSLSWGWVGQMTWPISGVVISVFLVTTASLIMVRLFADEDRDRVVVFSAVACGVIALAAGIGWGRSGFGPLAGFAVRYGILMLPLIVAGYLAWVRVGTLVPMAMFSLALLFLTQHTRTGLAEGMESIAAMAAFAEDLHNGIPPAELARRHSKLYPHPEVMAGRIRMLQTARVPRYLHNLNHAQR